MNEALTRACPLQHCAKDQKNQHIVGHESSGTPEDPVEGIPDDLHKISHICAEMLQDTGQIWPCKSKGYKTKRHDHERPTPSANGQQNDRCDAQKPTRNIHWRGDVKACPKIGFDPIKPDR